MRISLFVALSLSALVVSGGCGYYVYEAAPPTTLREVDRIRNDAALDANEKREALVDLGFSPAAINGLLRAERLANQFGGTLRSAYDKIVDGRLTDLTADEIQLYGDAASAAEGDFSVNIIDSQAQEVLDFFGRNNLNTADEVETFLEDPLSEFDEILANDLITPLFVEFDPDLVIDQLP